MLGDLIAESTGKRIVRRVLSTDPLKVEVSFEDSGTMLGTPTTGFGTYTAVGRADGSLHGEGEGASATADGEFISWKGSPRGRSCLAAPSAIGAFCSFERPPRNWRA